MFIKTFYFNPFRECTYVITAEEPKGEAMACLIVDPGCYEAKEEQRLAEYIEGHKLKPVAVLITHAHPDHMCGLEFVQENWPEAEVIDRDAVGSWTASLLDVRPACGLTEFRIIPTPGHKEDCVCYYFEKEGILFSGDTLFQEGIGRTDLPGGDYAELMQSLATLKQLPPETKVYPGHGYTTTIGDEIEHGPLR